MASEVRLPRLGQGMESGTILRWLKLEGERVEKGEPLYEVETEKATQEVEAEASGILLRIAVASGEVPVGQMVAMIGQPGEALAQPRRRGASSKTATHPYPPKKKKKMRGASCAAAETDFRAAISDARHGGRVKASPLARRMAREDAVDLRQLSGSGPDGRIVAEDVERAASVGGGPSGPSGPTEPSEPSGPSSPRALRALRGPRALRAPRSRSRVGAGASRSADPRCAGRSRGG